MVFGHARCPSHKLANLRVGPGLRVAHRRADEKRRNEGHDRFIQVRLAPMANPPAFRSLVSAGRWAISAFEDRNGNGILDLGFCGPVEPFGFWKPLHAWRKPQLGDVAIACRAVPTSPRA